MSEEEDGLDYEIDDEYDDLLEADLPENAF